MIGIFDTHAHLDYEYEGGIDGYLSRAAAAGVTRILTVGSNQDNWDQLRAWSERDGGTSPEIFYSVGFHPHDATVYNSKINSLMSSHLSNPRCVALGEIGLDYHYDHSPRPTQIAACRDQLQLAASLNKPVIIHSRDGEEDLLPLLEEFTKAQAGKLALGTEIRPKLGIIHCFSGSTNFAKSCIDLGFMISFSGIVTFKKADEVRAAVEITPIDRILIETDSPYLAPVPFRGKVNESALIVHTAQLVAEIKGISVDDLITASTENALHLFNLH